MTDEQFVSFFIAPNLTWKQAYEDMVEKRSLGKDKQAQILIYEVEQRIKYEIMLEFGLAGNIGRTLEKSNCSVISFATEDIIRIADAVQERTINELGVLTSENSDSFKRMVIGYLNLMRTNGAFEDKVFDEYTMGDGNGYMLSNDRNRWLPGRQSGRNTPRFIAEHIGNGRASFEFDSPAANKYVDWIASCCNEVLVDDSTFRAISKFILDEAVKQNVISLVPSSVNYKIYGLNKERVFITDDVMQMRCDKCGSVYRLIRALAGEEHPNDIFIVGDSHQRIYRNHPTLSKCGINVRGRSSILKINYRTTEEIRKHAFALLNGISFDDLDEDLDLGDKCQSLTHGEKPIVENFGNANDEFDFLLREVKKLKENGVSLTDICVVARTKKLVDDYIALFTRAGIRSYAIKRNKVDDRSFDGLRVATMHRVKGLEFKYVFIAAVNNRIIPLPSAINKTDAVSEAESITSEKCLLYVAMTRAQKGVYITSYGRPSEFLG